MTHQEVNKFGLSAGVVHSALLCILLVMLALGSGIVQAQSRAAVVDRAVAIFQKLQGN